MQTFFACFEFMQLVLCGQKSKRRRVHSSFLIWAGGVQFAPFPCGMMLHGYRRIVMHCPLNNTRTASEIKLTRHARMLDFHPASNTAPTHSGIYSPGFSFSFVDIRAAGSFNFSHSSCIRRRDNDQSGGWSTAASIPMRTALMQIKPVGRATMVAAVIIQMIFE